MHKHVHVFVISDLCSIRRFSSILLMDDFTRADFSEQMNLKIGLFETVLVVFMLVGDPSTLTCSCICFTGLVLNREVFVNTFDG